MYWYIWFLTYTDFLKYQHCWYKKSESMTAHSPWSYISIKIFIPKRTIVTHSTSMYRKRIDQTCSLQKKWYQNYYTQNVWRQSVTPRWPIMCLYIIKSRHISIYKCTVYVITIIKMMIYTADKLNHFNSFNYKPELWVETISMQ